VPDDDATAVATLAVTGDPAIWTFSPTPGAFGSYRIELIVDEGLVTESRSIRIFAVRTAAGIRVPALNERADPEASLINSGSDEIAASEDNEPSPSGPFVGGNYGGWYREIQNLLLTAGGGPGSLTEVFAWDPALGTTQFDAPQTYVGDFGPGPSAPVLSVVPDATLVTGQKLRLSASGTGNGMVVAWITDPIAQLGQTLLFEFRVAGNLQSQASGIAFLSDTVRVNAISPFGLFTRRDDTIGFADERTSPITALDGPDVMSLNRLFLRSSGDPPVWTIDMDAWGSSSVGGIPGTARPDVVVRSSDAENYGVPLGPYAPEWTGATLNRVGLALQTQGGTAFGDFDVEFFRIFSVA